VGTQTIGLVSCQFTPILSNVPIIITTTVIVINVTNSTTSPKPT
jgi:hypothetical protein